MAASSTSPSAGSPGLLARLLSAPNIVLLLVCIMYGLTYIDRINVATAGPVMQRELHLSPIQLGWVVSAFGWAYLALQVSGGWFSDRFGARLTLTICGVIWAGATIMMGLVGSLWALIIARVLLGLGEGATFPTATRALSDWAPPGRRAWVQGITHAFARFGNAITPPLVAWLIRVSSWRRSFVIIGAVSMAWAGIWWLYFRDDPRKHSGTTSQQREDLATYAARTAKKKEPVPWGPLFRRMAPVTTVYFCYGWTLWLYLTWLPSFFLHNYKLDLKHSAISSSEVYIFGAIGNTVGGIASDYILRRTGDRNKARRNIVVICFLLSLAFMLPVMRFHDVNIAAACLAVAFFFTEFTIGAFWAMPMDIAPRFSGTASGIMNIGSALAAAVSPLVAFYVIQKTNNWDLPFLGSIGLLLFGAIIAYWMKPNEMLAGAEVVTET
ncbi:MAG TPA: MFS transporter [Verrucomicrobiae bacterium]|jgi:MFS family permease|nr:MFS transporter [Verrucomicrobiae bacterium]